LAEKHPYSPAGGGGIATAILQLRKTFPAKVTSETLKKLGIASNSESYVINVLRFVGIIDAQGGKTKESTEAFSKHNDGDFQKSFGEMVKIAYSELFNLRGDGAWELPMDDLINFFRTNDQTSDITGRRQAITFQTLASLAGHGEPSAPPKTKQSKAAKTKTATTKPPKAAKHSKAGSVVVTGADNGHNGASGQRDFGLTVRVEVNLPPAADQETYDRIFRSIRENLLNAK
jgi:Family of unknown function (DUF5343)